MQIVCVLTLICRLQTLSNLTQGAVCVINISSQRTSTTGVNITLDSATSKFQLIFFCACITCTRLCVNY